MPFMIGPNPVLRTWKYLESGKIYLKDRIKIFIIHYCTGRNYYPRHQGASDFVTWHLPQVQYKNPLVQCQTIVNKTPSPFIRCFVENGDDIIIDIDNRTKDEIVDHVIQVLGKPPYKIQQELMSKEKKENPANFGFMCKNHCMCDVLGQVPCPSIVPVPKHMRGKHAPKGEFGFNAKL